MDLTPIIVASIGAVAGIASVIFQIMRDHKKNQADTSAIIEQTAARIAERNAKLEARADLQEERISLLETQLRHTTALLAGAFIEVDALRLGVDLLTEQLIKDKIIPIWTTAQVIPARRVMSESEK